MNDFNERRAYVRIHLRAYACDKTCTLLLGHKKLHACLVDISAGGARLLLDAPLPDAKAQSLIFTLEHVAHGGLLSGLPSTVRWANGKEIGIQFETTLNVAAGTLQKLVS